MDSEAQTAKTQKAGVEASKRSSVFIASASRVHDVFCEPGVLDVFEFLHEASDDFVFVFHFSFFHQAFDA
jgi:hypothetical protein